MKRFLGPNPFYRTLIGIALALALPTLVLIVLQVTFAYEREQESIKSASVARAEHIMGLVQGRLDSDLAAMRVLAGADVIDNRDWAASAARAAEAASVNPGWTNVIISDLEAGVEVLNLRRANPASPAPLSPVVTDPALFPGDGVGGVTRTGLGCPCIYLNQRLSDPDLVLTVAVDPMVVQNILVPLIPPDAVGAVVDAQGIFVGRSRAFAERVGTPATVYVREALRKGRSGVYAGTTYEGLRNYTAYVKSEPSAWSTHIALQASLVERPRTRSILTVIGGAVGAILVAVGAIALALNGLAARRREEDRLVHAQKLEALGRLTGGVAHDFNNLLTVVVGSLDMLAPKLDDPRQRRWADNALEAARRGAKLTRQLLAFSRGQSMEIRPVNLISLLDRMRDLLRQSMGPDIFIEFDIDPTHYWVLGDENQLELAILNLAINARDAMTDGGSLTITVRPAAKDTVHILVTDTGVGMSKAVLDRAMEPFFTTKSAASGTGLGLAQVFGAVQQAGGKVKIDSAPGAGTTVTLILPQAEPQAADPAAAEAAPRAGGGRRRVLVVDDEQGVRDVMAEVLRQAGFIVSEAPDGATALRHLDSDRIDLLVTDFAMPGMNGAELTLRARNQRPGLRTLIASGQADVEAVNAARTDGPLLKKPFTADQLLAAVHAALEQG